MPYMGRGAATQDQLERGSRSAFGRPWDGRCIKRVTLRGLAWLRYHDQKCNRDGTCGKLTMRSEIADPRLHGKSQQEVAASGQMPLVHLHKLHDRTCNASEQGSQSLMQL